jgi:3-dehydroquinate synthase
MVQTVRVELGSRSYDVVVGDGVVSELAARAGVATHGARRCLVVADDELDADLTTRLVVAQLQQAGVLAHVMSFSASEAGKSLASVDACARECVRLGLDRNDILLALGGGITGDLTGFVAASYKRGVRWVQCPTTLLAMVDASVGGKTGVNLLGPAGTMHKNMVGAFHQPALVLVDTRWLRTLPARHLRCGLAECLKHAMIAGSVAGAHHGLSLESFASDAGDMLGAREHAGAFIARQVRLKARVVEGDERETASDDVGGRALLNLGHTFAHVMEQYWSEHLLHGEAVGLGLIAAAATSVAMRQVPEAQLEQVRGLVQGVGLPTSLVGVGAGPTTSELVGAMHHDKKAVGGALRLVLPVADGLGKLGQAIVVRNPPIDAVMAGWEAVRA